MLKLRIITSIALLPLAIWLIFYSTLLQFSGCVAVILCLAAWEWTKLSGINNVVARLLVITGYILTTVILQSLGNAAITNISLGASILWVGSLIAILRYPSGTRLWQQTWLKVLLGIWLFVPAWLGIVWLKSNPNLGVVWLSFLCCLVCSADIGAYIVGKSFGTRKLAPAVSASKTWAGVIGGLLAGLLVALIFAHIWCTTHKLQSLLCLSIIVVSFSIIGDLVESIFKRVRGVKDSGTLLPGHGGILDRIDGFLAAVPVFISGVLGLGIVN